MTRIRSFKPEMAEDEALGRCSVGAQLTFDRLITQADDHGRFRANAVLLKGKLFPYLDALTPGEVHLWVEELDDAGLIQTYLVRNQQFGVLVSWAKHQRIDNAARPMHPGPDEADTDPPSAAAVRRELPLLAAGEEGKGGERSGPPRVRARERTSSSWLGRGEDTIEAYSARCVELGLGIPGDDELALVSRKSRAALGRGESPVDVLEGCRRAAVTNQAGLLDRLIGDAKRDRLNVPRTDRAAREGPSRPRTTPLKPPSEPDWEAQSEGVATVRRALDGVDLDDMKAISA